MLHNMGCHELALATTLGGLFIAGTKLTTADEDLFLSKGLASVPALLQKRLECIACSRTPATT